MDAEVDNIGDENKSGVSIEIIHASDSEDSEYESDFEEPTEANIDRSNGNNEAEPSDNSTFDEEELDKVLNDMENEEKEPIKTEENAAKVEETTSEEKQNGGEVEAISSGIEKDLNLNDEKNVQEVKDGESNENNDAETKEAVGEETLSAEIVGDRVLIERGGKFELVDVNEVKAEYFEMLGIKPDKKDNTATENTPNDEKSEQKPVEQEVSDEKPATNSKSPSKSQRKSSRPKTTNSVDARQKTNLSRNDNYSRAQSAHQKQPNPEFSYIKSRYGMTEQQLEIKRKREEAIARRKKEEEEREREESERKRDDAERAFQAWLNAKNEELKEFRRDQAKNRPDPNEKEEKKKEALQAYQHWREAKRQQDKTIRQYEESRLMEEAESFVVRDRSLCEEAFRRWLKRKNGELRVKLAAKRKLEKKKRRRKRKEQLPMNSDRIKYVEYYGYRNTVVF